MNKKQILMIAFYNTLSKKDRTDKVLKNNRLIKREWTIKYEYDTKAIYDLEALEMLGLPHEECFEDITNKAFNDKLNDDCISYGRENIPSQKTLYCDEECEHIYPGIHKPTMQKCKLFNMVYLDVDDFGWIRCFECNKNRILENKE